MDGGGDQPTNSVCSEGYTHSDCGAYEHASAFRLLCVADNKHNVLCFVCCAVGEADVLPASAIGLIVSFGTLFLVIVYFVVRRWRRKRALAVAVAQATAHPALPPSLPAATASQALSSSASAHPPPVPMSPPLPPPASQPPPPPPPSDHVRASRSASVSKYQVQPSHHRSVPSDSTRLCTASAANARVSRVSQARSATPSASAAAAAAAAATAPAELSAVRTHVIEPGPAPASAALVPPPPAPAPAPAPAPLQPLQPPPEQHAPSARTPARTSVRFCFRSFLRRTDRTARVCWCRVWSAPTARSALGRTCPQCLLLNEAGAGVCVRCGDNALASDAPPSARPLSCRVFAKQP